MCRAASLVVVAAARAPLLALYILVHAHNPVALLILATVFSRPRLALGLLLGCGALTALMLAGAADRLVHASAGASLSGMAAYMLPPAALDAWGARVRTHPARFFTDAECPLRSVAEVDPRERTTAEGLARFSLQSCILQVFTHTLSSPSWRVGLARRKFGARHDAN